MEHENSHARQRRESERGDMSEYRCLDCCSPNHSKPYAAECIRFLGSMVTSLAARITAVEARQALSVPPIQTLGTPVHDPEIRKAVTVRTNGSGEPTDHSPGAPNLSTLADGWVRINEGVWCGCDMCKARSCYLNAKSGPLIRGACEAHAAEMDVFAPAAPPVEPAFRSRHRVGYVSMGLPCFLCPAKAGEECVELPVELAPAVPLVFGSTNVKVEPAPEKPGRVCVHGHDVERFCTPCQADGAYEGPAPRPVPLSRIPPVRWGGPIDPDGPGAFTSREPSAAPQGTGEGEVSHTGAREAARAAADPVRRHNGCLSVLDRYIREREAAEKTLNAVHAVNGKLAAELAALRAAAGTSNGSARLARLRGAGWMVAVHNDYRKDRRSYTFWLLTHADGRWVKGEAETDEEALKMCEEAAGPVETKETE